MGLGNLIEKELSMLQSIATASNNYNNTVQTKSENGVAFSGINMLNKINEYVDSDNSIKLEASLLNQFEQAFDCDLSSIRIHTGKYADELTRMHNAEAITIGTDIYFSNGKYSPDSDSGLALLSHELQHAIQSLRQTRLSFPEDIAKAESQASKIENALNQFRLHNIAGPMLSSSQAKLPVDEVSDHLENDSIQNSFDSIINSGIEDIVENNLPVEYQIKLRSGKTITLNKSEMEMLYFEFASGLKIIMNRFQTEHNPDDYEHKLVKFMGNIE